MRLVLLLFSCLLCQGALAWGAAGHRLVACLAWDWLSPATQAQTTALLLRHPDSARWQRRNQDPTTCALLAEAATWPDDIKQDVRFHDEEASPAATAPFPGLSDMARHRHWHYVDFDAAGQIVHGDLARQMERQAQQVAHASAVEAAAALPWLVHLVADAHQPLHAGRAGDQGGNAVPLYNPFNPRPPQGNLHAFWDELPGPPWLRGQRLRAAYQDLRARYVPAAALPAAQWPSESHALLGRVYPPVSGDGTAKVDAAYLAASRQLAEQRLVDAGKRLAQWLETLMTARVSRETRSPE